MKKQTVITLIIALLVFNGCKEDDPTAFKDPYIKTEKAYQSGTSTVYVDISYGYIICASSPETGVVWSTSPNPTILNNKTVFTRECYLQSGGNILVNGVPANTMIYIRAYSLTRANAEGIIYSNEISYKTN